MIGVVVGPHDAIKPVNSSRQQLLPQVCGRIYEQTRAAARFDHDRNPGPPVTGFVRVAIAPVISDPWYTCRRTAAEHDELHDLAFWKS
jgi:hypothetical protein